jgi:transcriptional regulator with XRE-family HTH domain/ActR/RegA family two-component response regulator
MQQNDQHIGRKIKELRKKKSLSLEQLGQLCGCSKSYMSRIENGRRRIDVERLQCIARELEVSPDYFFDSGEVDSLPQFSKKKSKILRIPSPFPTKSSSDDAGKVYELTLRFEGGGKAEKVGVAKIEKFVATTSNANFSKTESVARPALTTGTGPRKVLIVDDKPFIIEFIKDALDTFNIKLGVECAYSCNEALEKFKKNLSQGKPVALVLLDYVGIEGSGKDTLKEMVRLHPNLPVIAMTGYGNRETRQNALNNGAFDFLEKPISLHELIKSVERALKLSDGIYPSAQVSS